MKIQITDRFFLSPPTVQDIETYIECMKDKTIYDQTLSIPFPYNYGDAMKYVELCKKKNLQFKVPIAFSIRDTTYNNLIGDISAFDFDGTSHKAEIGYWMSVPYRGCGIMTQAVGVFCYYLIENFKFVRLGARTFDFNIASQRVLEKNGFILEGTMKKFYCKDGKFFDAKMYGRVS